MSAPRPIVSLLLALAPLLSACASLTPPDQLSYSAVVLEAPLVKQDELYECGLAAISALCDFHSVSIPEATRAELVRLAAEEQGLSGTELRSVLETCGLEVFIFSATLDHGPTGLLRQVDEGRPTLVMISVDNSNHYVLFIGYDPEFQSVVLLDPRRGRVILPSSTFERLWDGARRFTLLAVPGAD